MQTTVSATEMRWCDNATIRGFGIPGLLLMEQAGKGVAEAAVRTLGSLRNKLIVIFCGKGNNGGDGFVVARHLLNQGCKLKVILLASPAQLEGDAKTNHAILTRLAHAHRDILLMERFSPTLLKRIGKSDLLIDAIFGTGFSGEIRSDAAKAIAWINAQGAPVIAVDIPSGVNGTTGIAAFVAVRATKTVTFGLAKTGLLCNQGRDLVGEIEIVDIGIPPAVSGSKKLRTFLLTGRDLKNVLPRRSSTAHKYSVGKVLVVAGSKGFTGAAHLCSQAVLRSGAGAVMLATPESVYPILARRLAEAIVIPLAATAEGSLSKASIPVLKEKLKWADVVVIGPGLSANEEAQAVIKTLLSISKGNVVIDADALRVVAELGLGKMSRLKARFILTPHAGEFSRIARVPSGSVEANRVELAREGGKKGKLALVLKGGPTAVGLPDGTVILNSTGNPGMATVGSGDVLAGVIGGLWAQGMTRDLAAYSGVFLHGLAGDLAKNVLGERSIVASDLIEYLPAAIGRVESL